jgi:hypothetical protein
MQKDWTNDYPHWFANDFPNRIILISRYSGEKMIFRPIIILFLTMIILGCSPSVSIVQTAIAQTQDASITVTPTLENTSTPKPMATLEPTATSSILQIRSIPTDLLISGCCDLHIKKTYFGEKILPPNTSGYYTYYEAKSPSSTYMDIVMEIKNLDTMIKAAEDFASVSILYDNKYTYQASPILVDNNGDFTLAFYGIEPLLKSEVHYLVEVPNEVQNSLKPLELIIKAPGKEYHYKYR